MGIGSCDIRVDIQLTDRSLEKANEIVSAMNEDDTFSKVNLLTTKMFWTDSDEMIKVELGNHSIFPVAYSTGKLSQYQQAFPFAKISGIREYITQTFGQTILSVKTASYTAIAIALLLTLLITLLFMKMLIARDTYSIAVLKALGEIIVGMAISSFGASSFSFMINPVWAYILCPLMMGGTVLIATLAGVIGAGKISIRENSSPLM